MTLTVEKIPPERYPEWEEFIEMEETGTIFHSTKWYSLWNAEFQVIVAKESGQIVGGIVFTTTSRGPFKIIGAPPLTPICRPVIKVDPGLLPSTAIVRSRRIEQALLSAMSGGLIHHLLYHTKAPDPIVINGLGFRTFLYQTYEIKAKGVNWQTKINKQTRTHLKKAQKLITSDRLQISNSVDQKQVAYLLGQTAGIKGYKESYDLYPDFVDQLITKGAPMAVDIDIQTSSPNGD